ncbi:hypothetical protein [Marinifilum flexuosum]|uniref:hypothetical protein n=1 Tax=Marinifilum flexuosum TaxID=1117708 RepID=UPI00248F7D7C|nr:hypothetical protein [Marinifilum flexuosum]
MTNIQNTPLDYSDNRIWVYFELGGSKDIASDYILSQLDFISQEQITKVKYGFNLFICNQQIPEVVRILEKENQAIYQVIRID